MCDIFLLLNYAANKWEVGGGKVSCREEFLNMFKQYRPFSIKKILKILSFWNRFVSVVYKKDDFLKIYC